MSGTTTWISIAAAVAGTTGCGGPQLAWSGYTPDRAHLVEVRQDGRGQWLAVDGRASGAYRYVAADEIAFDPGGRRLAFAAEVRERPERWVVVTDFVQGRSWDGVAALRFGPGGRRMVYAALDGRRWRMVVDGAPGPSFDDVDPDAVRFSPGGRRVGYVADDAGCAHIVIGGLAGPCVGRVAGLALADDPGHDVQVIADAPDGSDARIQVGADRGLDVPYARELTVDPAVRHWAIVAGDPGHTRLVVDGRAGDPFDAVERIVWSADGASLAYAARRDGAWHIVRDGRVGPPYAEVEDPVFAVNGSHFGYIGRERGRSVVSIDDRTVWESTEAATALAFSDDGSHVAWVYRDGPSAVIAVDDARYRFEVAIERTLRFTHDGKHWAALVGSLAQRQLFVVVDGHARIPFDAAELFSSPSGDPAARLGSWVAAELRRYVARGESTRGS